MALSHESRTLSSVRSLASVDRARAIHEGRVSRLAVALDLLHDGTRDGSIQQKRKRGAQQAAEH